MSVSDVSIERIRAAAYRSGHIEDARRLWNVLRRSGRVPGERLRETISTIVHLPPGYWAMGYETLDPVVMSYDGIAQGRCRFIRCVYVDTQNGIVRGRSIVQEPIMRGELLPYDERWQDISPPRPVVHPEEANLVDFLSDPWAFIGRLTETAIDHGRKHYGDFATRFSDALYRRLARGYDQPPMSLGPVFTFAHQPLVQAWCEAAEHEWEFRDDEDGALTLPEVARCTRCGIQVSGVTDNNTSTIAPGSVPRMDLSAGLSVVQASPPYHLGVPAASELDPGQPILAEHVPLLTEAISPHQQGPAVDFLVNGGSDVSFDVTLEGSEEPGGVMRTLLDAVQLNVEYRDGRIHMNAEAFNSLGQPNSVDYQPPGDGDLSRGLQVVVDEVVPPGTMYLVGVDPADPNAELNVVRLVNVGIETEDEEDDD